MTIEKRGSEKLLQMESDLCPLTDEELKQISGGASPHAFLTLKDYFPIGILPPELVEMTKYETLNDRINVPRANQISNGF